MMHLSMHSQKIFVWEMQRFFKAVYNQLGRLNFRPEGQVPACEHTLETANVVQNIWYKKSICCSQIKIQAWIICSQ